MASRKAEVAERLSKLERYVEQQKSWKEKYEELEKQFADVRTKVYNELKEEVDKRVEEERQKAMEKVEEIKKQWNVEELQKTIMTLNDENIRLRENQEKDEEIIKLKEKKIADLTKELEGFRELKSALAKIIPVPQVQIPAGPQTPSEISVTTEQPAISVKVERKPLSLTDKDLHGKIAVVYSEGALGEGWFSVSDVVKAFHRHAWRRDPRISTALDEFTQWGYFEKKYAGKKPIYKVQMSPKEAKEKGLLKIEES